MKNEELVALVALLDSFQAMKVGFIGNRLQLTLCIRPTADSEDEHAVSVVDTGPLNAATFTVLYHSASGKEIWQKKIGCRKPAFHAENEVEPGCLIEMVLVISLLFCHLQ